MPDRPNPGKRAHPSETARSATGRAVRYGRCQRRYAELCCHSNFSFLRGASHPEELVDRAADLGYEALAVTDRNTLAGVVRMYCAARARGLKLIVGAELTPVDAPAVTLYATDRAAYGRLCRIITAGRLRAKKGECHVTLDDIATWNEGLIAVVHPDQGSREQGTKGSRMQAPAGDTTPPHLSLDPSIPQSLDPFPSSLRRFFASSLLRYRSIFSGRVYLAASVHGGPDDERRLAQMGALSRAVGIPMVASNDVYYHEPQRRFLQDVLTCVREHCTLEEAGQRLFANAERHLKPIEEMVRLFAEYPEAIARTIEIADRCTFTLDELRYEYPEALCPPDRTPHQFLSELTWVGARERYPAGIPEKVRRLIEHELDLIRTLEYEPYFLTVWDVVRFARSRGILCQGRGSAANSAVCYCLGVTAVDPDRIELLFERFVSAERNEPPDIDVDFEHERREEVFQYIYDKYGRDHAAIVAEVISYRPRSAIRDVGKALGLSLDHVDALAKKHEWWDREVLPESFVRETGLAPDDRTLRMLRRLVRQLVGFPRHLSQHVGGFVITRGPLCEMVPIENAAMPDRTFIEWDKDDIDALGILKIDCLALGMLTAIRKCFDLLRTNNSPCYGHLGPLVPRSLDAFPSSLADVPAEDPEAYKMIRRADTIGVFQIESRAQMSMLPRLKPRCFYDLVIEVAIVRPGPIQGGMVHPYLRRRSGEEPITYPNDAVRGVLERTLGVPLFQEQAMRLAVVAGDFTPGEADQLRRAMGAWRRNGDIARFHTRLIEGMTRNGLSPEFAEQCFEQISGFGEYGFPESHAASFALLVYVSAWLKRYHPAVFCAAIINSQPMGFYQPAQLVRDAREHGVTVLPVDVNYSGYDCRLEKESSDPRIEAPRQEGTKGRKGGLPESTQADRFRPARSGCVRGSSPDRGDNDNVVTTGVSPWSWCARKDKPRRGERRQGSVSTGRIGQFEGRSYELQITNYESQENASGDGPDSQHPIQTQKGLCDPSVPSAVSQSTIDPPEAEQSTIPDDPAPWGRDGPPLRLGMRLVRGLSRAHVEGIEQAQRQRSFTSVADLFHRSGATRATLARLAAADAFRSLGLSRREALWQVLHLDRTGPGPLFDGQETPEPPASLPAPSLDKTVMDDYETTGLSLNAHPLELLRKPLNRLGVQPASELKQAPAGTRMRVAGLVLVRQRPGTARGIVFCTLEDETGPANLIIGPKVYDRYRATARAAAILIADGRVERQGEVIHLHVTRLRDCSAALAELRSVSRDFH